MHKSIVGIFKKYLGQTLKITLQYLSEKELYLEGKNYFFKNNSKVKRLKVSENIIEVLQLEPFNIMVILEKVV